MYLDPSVSIVLLNESATIREGDTIRTELRTELVHPTPTSPIQVSISVNQVGGDYIAFRVPRVVEMTSRIEPLNISTHDDSFYDGEGTIRITISATSTDFTIASGENAYVEIVVSNDLNDENVVEESRISVAEAAVDFNSSIFHQFSVLGQPRTRSAPATELPKVSVAAVTPVVDEGAPVHDSLFLVVVILTTM